MSMSNVAALKNRRLQLREIRSDILATLRLANEQLQEVDAELRTVQTTLLRLGEGLADESERWKAAT